MTSSEVCRLLEKFFDLIQETYKKHLKGKGVIEPDYQERGAHDYRKDACLTMVDFEKIILHCMIYYNSKRIIENFPYTEATIANNVKPYASCIWEWSKSQIGANLISVDSRELILTLLPRTKGVYDGTANENGRPERVSEKLVYREMNLLGHQLENMPRCKAVFEKYTESYPESWARKIIWAYRKLEEEGKPFCWTDVRRISGVKKKNLPEIVPCLIKYVDEDVVGKILNLIVL